MYKDKNIGLLEFFQLYSHEEECIKHFVAERKADGITCSRCKTVTKHYYISTIRQFRCSCCNKKQGLRANTYMADSNMPLNFWYFVSYMMTNFTKSFSAKELQRQLKQKRYEPIWTMMHKIRATMRDRDKLYFLNHHLSLIHI